MLQPLRGKILVEIIPDEKQTASGLYIAQTAKEVPHRGRVVNMGLPFTDEKGKESIWDIRLGDIVHFKRKWTEFTEGNKNVILLRDDVVAFERVGDLFASADNVVVRRHYTKKIGNSSLIIPEGMGIQQNYEEFYGEVLSIGIYNTMDIEDEDKILYHRNEGTVVKFKDEELWSLKPRAILALLTA